MQNISVRELVEFVYQSGDLKITFVSTNRMLQGTHGHRYVQKKRVAEWQNEVYVKKEDIDKTGVTIAGRIDGVFTAEDATVIEEIKTYLGSPTFVRFMLSDFIEDEYWREHKAIFGEYQSRFVGLSFLHIAQALIYAYIYCDSLNIDEVVCRLNYVKVGSHTEQIYDVLCDKEFLKTFFDYTYTTWWLAHRKNTEIKRRSMGSLKHLESPYQLRVEQRKMAVAVYKNIASQTNLFSRAPTGTGKTLATLFPALKALGEEHTDKVFYLTAKTSGRTVAEHTLQLLHSKGADVRYCVITAKEKVCLKEFSLCEPEYCEFAADYWNKQKEALKYAFTLKVWNYHQIQAIARRFVLCPFELSLALSTYAEVVICDYNYCFDPIIYLRRHFDEVKDKFTFLIDEAHNLIDRAREMYSRDISSGELSEWIEHFPKKYRKIHSLLSAMYVGLKEFYPLDKDFFTLPQFPSRILQYIENIIVLIEKSLEKKNKPYEKYYMLKVYFQLVFLYNCITHMTKNHVVYYSRDERGWMMKVFCINPRDQFVEYLKNAKSAIFFSATLHPFEYFCEVLSKNDKDHKLSVLSPFDKERFGLYIYNGINTVYKYREQSYEPLATLIENVCNIKTGNYMIYFPSFSFQKKVYEVLLNRGISNIVMQRQNMSENERIEFLSLFEKTDRQLIGLCVLGGIFGEGIDLIGDKLVGVIIVSVGLPVLGGERGLVKDYYDVQLNKGFDYAYQFPGFNKVMQAAGRVIRSEEDKGIVILVDQRYTRRDYKQLYPADWKHYQIFSDMAGLTAEVKKFWGSEE